MDELNEKQKQAIALITNCLLSLGVEADMNETFNEDLWKAAELFGVSKLDLLMSCQIKNN